MKKNLSAILFTFIVNISFGQITNSELYNFGSGLTIGSSATFSYLYRQPNLTNNTVIKKSLIAGTTIGLVKETHDVAKYGIKNFDVKDIISLSLGTVAGSLIVNELQKKFRKKPNYRNCPQF